MPEQKYMNLKDFRQLGYLQELNRRFLHPLGLALEIYKEDNGDFRFGKIWDNREDKEGIYFDICNSDFLRKQRFLLNKNYIDLEFQKRKKARCELFNIGHAESEIIQEPI